jgi:hypothetical protein
VAVLRAYRLLPLALIAEAISEAFISLIEGQPQKSQIARGEVERSSWSVAPKFFEQDCDNERASVVIR